MRRNFSGTIALSGSIANGASILAAQAMGADLAYMRHALHRHAEANASPTYKQMLVDTAASDIVYSSLFTGVHGNYLGPSIVGAGLDPKNLPEGDKTKMSFGSGGSSKSKAWRDIWGAGQGVGSINDIPTVADCVAPAGGVCSRCSGAVRAHVRRCTVAGCAVGRRNGYRLPAITWFCTPHRRAGALGRDACRR